MRNLLKSWKSDMSMSTKSSKCGRNPPEKSTPVSKLISFKFFNPKCVKFDEQSEIGHVHEHQKLQVRAKPSRKICPFFFEDHKFQWRAKPSRKTRLCQSYFLLTMIETIKICFSGAFGAHGHVRFPMFH